MAFRKDYRPVPPKLAKQVREEEKYCAHCFRSLPTEEDRGAVDHIIPDYRLPPGHVLKREDVQLLCTPCHAVKTKRETTAARKAAAALAKHPRRR